MQEFMMIFRYDPTSETAQNFQAGPTAISAWQDWIGGIARAGKLVQTSRLGMESYTIDTNGKVTQEILSGTFISGNMLVKAASMEDAIAMVNHCPILSLGGTVVLRDVLPMG